MFAESILVIIFFGLACLAYYLHSLRSKQLAYEDIRNNKINSLHDDVRKILRAGIYQRYKREDGKTVDTPFDFEYFVAKTIQITEGGICEVTPSNNDGGIDILHFLDEGLELVQVKCYAPNNKVDFEPIAILHSQMIKQNANAAVVITTSSFSQEAIKYASEVNVRLIDGEQFLDMWLKSITITVEEIGEGVGPSLTPFYT